MDFPNVWDLPPGDELVLDFRAGTKDPRWILYAYTTVDDTPFITMVRAPELGRMQRDLWLERRGMAVPKPEPKPKPEPVPASECTNPRCNERGSKLEALA